MRTIESSIVIAAAPERVWTILVDFARYAEWNPFIPRAEGRPVVGATLTLFIRPPGEKGMTHQPTVLVADRAGELQWLGKVAVPGLLSARHSFTLESVGEGTRLRQREEFRGLLVPLLRRTLDRTGHGFVQLNAALKERAEAAG